MARAVAEHWPVPLSGLVVTRYGHGVPVPGIEVVEASHPVPDSAGRDAAARILELVTREAAGRLRLSESRGTLTPGKVADVVVVARDPRETVAFWARMAEAGGPEGPEFLSTHPSHGTRISDLHALMPEALAIFAEAPSP